MSTPAIRKYDEVRVAEEIVGVLSAEVTRTASNHDTIRFAIRGADLKLRSVVFRRESLRRLIDDPAFGVKVEYLQRDLAQSAAHRAEYRYPHAFRSTARAAARTRARALPVPFPLASLF